MNRPTKILLGTTGSICVLSLFNGWIGVITGLAALVWGSISAFTGKETPLSRLYATARKRLMGLAMLGLGTFLLMFGAATQAQRELRAEKRQIAVEAAERDESAKIAKADALTKELPDKLIRWDRNLKDARQAAASNELDRARKLVETERDAINQFMNDMTVAPLPLRDISRAYEQLGDELAKRTDIETATKQLSSEIAQARASIRAKDWYPAADHAERATSLLSRIKQAAPSSRLGLSPDIITSSQATITSLTIEIGDKAVQPSDLNIRQFLDAPKPIREKAVTLRWQAASTNSEKLGDMIRLAREKNVERESLIGILHCADGVARKDKTVIRTLGTIFNDVKTLAQPKRPASELIDICMLTFLAMAING